jgi:antitoxin StbD
MTSSESQFQVMNALFKPEPIVPILADVGVSISDLKRNPAAVVEAAKIQQVAILNRNRPVAYVISPEVWDHILDVFDDLKIAREMDEITQDELAEAIPVSLENL